MRSNDRRGIDTHRNAKSLGDPALIHRHRCEGCKEIFDCRPCPHYPSGFRQGTILRLCPACLDERKAA